MSTFGILGSGFGIYGYLPALLNLGHFVLIPEQYQDKINKRPELGPYLDKLEYSTEKRIIDICDNLVVARNPQRQYELVSKITNNKQKLFLEKPLAPTLEMHRKLLKKLTISNFDFSVGYLLQYTPWWREITKGFCASTPLVTEINWKISKPNGWKEIPNLGGGIPDYYGIHFVPILQISGVQFQPSDVVSSKNSMLAIFRNRTGAKLKVRIEYSSKSLFSVTTASPKGERRNIFSDASPFGHLPIPNSPDPRISVLEEYISSSDRIPKLLQSRLRLEENVLFFRKAFLQ
jgi:predicted dehydrogenase